MRELTYTQLVLALAAQVAVAAPRGLEKATVLSHARQVQDSYDYVIVGAGTAGLTVADRLTEDGKTTVLVVEVGQLSDSTRISTVQGGFQAIDAQFMYSINSVPQVNLRNKVTSVLAAKVVGGGSAINTMMTVRGTAEDYDRWGNFFSKSSEWSWQGMLPYFRKSLNFVPPDAETARTHNITYDTSYWGTTSGVYAAWPSFQYAAAKAQVDAFRGMPGVQFPPDSGAGVPGVYWYPTFMDPKTVTRSYARTGHYNNVKRPNYQLLTGNKVTRILFNGTTATGVSYIAAGGNPKTAPATIVRANKEVILAAGAIHTPQILQLSGIGPKKLLTSANIATLVDLPGVGQNFQDHPMITASFRYRALTVKPTDADLSSNATFRAWAQQAWTTNKGGPNAIATGNTAAWLPFPVISPRYEEVAATLGSLDAAALLPADTDPTVVAGYKVQLTALASALRSNGTAFYNLVFTGGAANGIIVDLHPLSRGTVNIDPKDPDGKEPIVDYRALTNPVDKLVMTDIIKYTRRFYMENPANSKYQPQEVQPGAAVRTDADFATYLSQSVSPTEFHPVGTAAMMPRELGGVVNEKLQVYGVGRLRVIDGSMMSTLPGGNTCQTVYAVAEKAADLIKAGI